MFPDEIPPEIGEKGVGFLAPHPRLSMTVGFLHEIRGKRCRQQDGMMLSCESRGLLWHLAGWPIRVTFILWSTDAAFSWFDRRL